MCYALYSAQRLKIKSPQPKMTNLEALGILEMPLRCFFFSILASFGAFLEQKAAVLMLFNIFCDNNGSRHLDIKVTFSVDIRYIHK